MIEHSQLGEPSEALVALIARILKEHRNRWVKNELNNCWDCVCTCGTPVWEGRINSRWISSSLEASEHQRKHKAYVILETVVQDCLVRKAARQIVKRLTP